MKQLKKSVEKILNVIVNSYAIFVILTIENALTNKVYDCILLGTTIITCICGYLLLKYSKNI